MQWNTADFETAAGISSQLPDVIGPEVVFSGRSNVGKSSLINRLTGRKNLARTSSSPGKTATINFYRMKDIRLVDLPGYGYAKVSGEERRRWSELIEGYFNADRDRYLVIQLIDSRHTPSKDDFQMISYLTEREIPFLLVLTKTDKLNKSERAARMAALEQELADYEGLTVIPFSAVTGEGTEELKTLLDEWVVE